MDAFVEEMGRRLSGGEVGGRPPSSASFKRHARFSPQIRDAQNIPAIDNTVHFSPFQSSSNNSFESQITWTSRKTSPLDHTNHVHHNLPPLSSNTPLLNPPNDNTTLPCLHSSVTERQKVQSNGQGQHQHRRDRVQQVGRRRHFGSDGGCGVQHGQDAAGGAARCRRKRGGTARRE